MKQLPRTMMAAATPIVASLSVASVDAQQDATGGRSLSYAGNMWSTKYSPLGQNTPDHFSNLMIARYWRSTDTHHLHLDELGASLVPAGILCKLLEVAEPNRWVTRPSI